MRYTLTVVTTPVIYPMLDLQREVQELWPELQPAVEGVLRSGAFIGGPVVEQFEAAAAEYLGVRHAIGLNSGTDALVLGLEALGVGPGDEVVGGRVVLGGPGAQHDVFDLFGVGASPDLGFELSEGVVDLAAPGRELSDDLWADPVDLPPGLAAGSPPNAVQMAFSSPICSVPGVLQA